jgi:hypothetical protein
VGAFAAACAAVFVPFVLLAPHGVEDSLRTQLGRHLQIETPLASVALLLHTAAGMGIGVRPEAHTYALGGTRANVLAAVTTVALIVALAGIWLASIRLARHDEGLVLGWAAALCAVTVLGRVLSPQYLIWLLPVLPLVRGRIGWLVSALLATACVLTNIWYPAHYGEVVRSLDGGSIALLFVRNLVLGGLLVILLAETARRARRVRDGAAPAAPPGLPARP